MAWKLEYHCRNCGEVFCRDAEIRFSEALVALKQPDSPLRYAWHPCEDERQGFADFVGLVEQVT